ncbi:MAG: division/cell wall cluster transcriptional repressor MraZ [Verrucomicrobiae bacterium]
MGQESTSTALYAGTFSRSLDAKKRVAIPSAWVSGEGEEFHVVPHPNDGQLMVMGREELARWEQRFLDSPTLSPARKRIAIRMFYGEAHVVTTDKQGRIVLPEKHCERAGLGGEVVFVGARSRFEIWSKERHEAGASENFTTYQQAAEEAGL